MNVMAHLALAGDNPDLILGQFIGDFIRGPVEDSPYPPSVQAGIRAHRRMDAACDGTAFYQMAKKLFPGRERRYAGIVLDVYGDHLLHRNWDALMPTRFGDANALWKAILAKPAYPMPPRATRFARTILDYDLLAAYRDIDEIRAALQRIGTRLRHPVRLDRLLDHLLPEEPGLEKAFPSFFRDFN